MDTRLTACLRARLAQLCASNDAPDYRPHHCKAKRDSVFLLGGYTRNANASALQIYYLAPHCHAS